MVCLKRYFYRIAVYFVFSFSVHNFRMQEAWKEQEKKIAQLSSELQLIHDNFDDDEWYGVSAATLQGSKDLKGALKTLIQAKLEERPATTSDSVPVPTSSDQIPGLSDVLGDSTKTSSKMI